MKDIIQAKVDEIIGKVKCLDEALFYLEKEYPEIEERIIDLLWLKAEKMMYY